MLLMLSSLFNHILTSHPIHIRLQSDGNTSVEICSNYKHSSLYKDHRKSIIMVRVELKEESY